MIEVTNPSPAFYGVGGARRRGEPACAEHDDDAGEETLPDVHAGTLARTKARILIGALEAKDPYTAGHAERVADYAVLVGRELRFTPPRLERLRFAALMHDVGKLVVPNHLLNKPGKLTAEEFDIVRRHEAVSVEILTRIDFLEPVAPSATSEAHAMPTDAAPAAAPRT